MSGSLSDWQVSDLIDYLTSGPWWASLHTADPRVGSPTAHELAGASYARQQLTVVAAGARVMNATNATVWANLPEATVTFLGIFTDVVGGNLRAAIPLPDSVAIAAGQGYTVPAEEIYVSW